MPEGKPGTVEKPPAQEVTITKEGKAIESARKNYEDTEKALKDQGFRISTRKLKLREGRK
jgi:hypothetical protein